MVLLITHHLGIVANYTQKLCVLYAGEVVEQGNTQAIIQNPQHPYTRALLESVPKNSATQSHEAHKTRLATIAGAPPDLTALPSGCIFHPRCSVRVDDCKLNVPVLRKIENPDREISCHLAPFK